MLHACVHRNHFSVGGTEVRLQRGYVAGVGYSGSLHAFTHLPTMADCRYENPSVIPYRTCKSLLLYKPALSLHPWCRSRKAPGKLYGKVLP